MNRSLFILALLLATSFTSQAQLGMTMSQYSGNQITYNPGYAGTYDLMSLNLGFRRLWTGIADAPLLVSFNGHAPLQRDRHALGFVYQREQWGALAGNTGYFNYAHKIKLGETYLSLGLQAGFLNYNTHWNKVDYVEHPWDPYYGPSYGREKRESTTRFDANFGAYYHTSNFFAGASVKHLARPKYGFAVDSITRQRNKNMYEQMRAQFYLMGGYYYQIDDEWSIYPEMFLRFEREVNVAMSVGGRVAYMNRYFAGFSLQTGRQSLSFILQAQVTPELRIGYTYDIHWSAIRPYQNGSHEILVSYNIFQLWKKETAVDLIWL